ncbi:uncharacterized protein CANTADRAFT_91038 [Suhomyces tanzawaensis NRRL Y-17324]|uniref:Thioesterase domain-containing protein n=1 Tax=Suhomyces tanzawaensis NRRL Y-17324 TaxID=984487 RepID=A0A1E4SGX8_9ASCO|nr:uncharacterized protein CANTADRAFT_91038 [Suhomyces tanzawaensis NRRL Y-17324]ODV78746.1 hypothetical protein CANTADRAFT_91038 [Suhomyces tanzawaensis NRRL Y-17324]
MHPAPSSRHLEAGPCNRVVRPPSYGTRSEHDSPFDHFAPRPKRWISWKSTLIFAAVGAALAYNETVFNWYQSYVSIDNQDPQTLQLLPMQLEYKLKNLPLYQELTHPRNAERWYKLLSWENLDRNVLEGQGPAQVKHQQEYTAPSLTTHTLAQPGGILIKPVIFHNIETDEGVTIVHLGYKLCGYPFLVHGGMLATLLNETYKRNASLSRELSHLKDDFMVENLTIEYKRPTLANQFLVVRTNKVETADKVVYMESEIQDKKGRTLVKSSARLRDTGRASGQMRDGATPKKWWVF